MIDEKQIKRFIEGAKKAYKEVDDPTFTFPMNILSAHELATSIEELLQAQETRLITKDDFEKADAWGTIPAWIEYNPAIEGAEPGWAIIDSDILGSPFKKAWTARPTEEQRKKAEWE